MVEQAENKSELIKAIAKAIGSMRKLAKVNENKFDRYNFVSIDNFLEATSEACHENGLVIVQDESGVEVIEKTTSKGKSSWLKMEFTFDVYHESGDKITGLKRSVAVPFTGAQAFGSAQSYALKQFLRSLFQITTGDKDDPDFQQTSRPEEAPAIKQPSNKWLSEQMQIALDEAATAVNDGDEKAFPTPDLFRQWVKKTCNRELKELSTDGANKILGFLEKNTDAAKWEDKYKAALAEVKTVAEAPF